MPEFPDSAVVQLTSGKVTGMSNGSVRVFRGIPYAASISGANRWRPPQPVMPWDGVRSCIVNGSICYQPALGRVQGFVLGMQRTGKAWIDAISKHAAREGDDCLNLNVWTPTLDSDARLPVLVWIHGGSFTAGAGSQPLYDGAALAATGMVVVTINYRLSIWGFMGGNGLFAGDLGCANRGFMDQVQALRWIHDNVRAFGGNPDCVTLMGESAGATSTIAMCMTPATDDLVHRAVVMSSAAITVFPHEEFSDLARDYFQMLGVQVGDGDALVRLSIDAVRAAKPSAPDFLNRYRDRYGALGRAHFGAFGMPLGTDLFPSDAYASLKRPGGKSFDLLIGTCRDESRGWTVCIPGPHAVVTRGMFEYHAGVMNPPGEPDITFRNYQQAMPGASDIAIYERAMTDALFRKSSVTYAGAHSAVFPGRTYLYRYDWASTAVDGELGAIYAIDIPGVFQTYEHAHTMLGNIEAARVAGDAMHDAVVNFVRTGRPASKALPLWAPYDTHTKACMVFDTESKLQHGIDRAVEAIW